MRSKPQFESVLCTAESLSSCLHCFAVIALLLILSASAQGAPHLADYDAELRQPDGRVDTEALAQRLKELGVSKYYWLIWHSTNDWEDLKLFLPKAALAHLEVWAYL